ncbi:MAG: ECF transporter S component [Eubacterium sp.]|nr:ECF transporter S component [Eubacterium sp.]
MKNTRVEMTTLAMLTAISCILVFISFPFPAMPAFKYELADVPILIATFAFGPVAGITVTVIASFVQAFILGQDGLMGFTMHVLASGSLVLVAGIIYRGGSRHTKKGAIIGLICGVITMTVVMCIANYVLDPIFYGMPKEAVAALIVPAVIPFNLSKAGINALVTFFVYKRISNLIHKAEGRAQSK